VSVGALRLLDSNSLAKRRFRKEMGMPEQDRSTSEDQAKREKRTEFDVITTAGDLDRTFPDHDHLKVVFDAALELVGGEGDADQYVLEYENEPLEDLHRTIGEWAKQLGWGERVQLELVPKPVVV
jgi:hypothetical protein